MGKQRKTKNIDLLEKVKRRNKNSTKRTRQNKKKLGISIEERPDKIKTREEFGNWEIDTVIGKKKKSRSPFSLLFYGLNFTQMEYQRN